MIARDFLLQLYFEMLRIRKIQLRIESLYHLDEMKTPIHLCVGQEAIAVGICATLRKDDYISSSHRGHGHYLAKGGDLKKMIAELYCRETGCSKGRGGSMHLVDVSVGHMGSSSIVGGGIPIGTGLALSAQMQHQDRVSVVFFGDGAADEGVLYESINFAVLKKLPVIYVYENNQYSVCSHVSARQADELLFHKMPSRLLLSQIINGNDVIAIYEAGKWAVERARRGEGPSLIECKTYRVRAHAGAGTDAGLGYRSAEEITAWEARCPLFHLQNILYERNILTKEEVWEMEKIIDCEIDEAFQSAQNDPLPGGNTVLKYVFCE